MRKVFLAGVAQQIERWPANQGVTGSIPSQDVLEGQPHIDVSLPLFLPPFLPLSLKIKR